MLNLLNKEVTTVLLTGHSYFGQIGHYHFGITTEISQMVI